MWSCSLLIEKESLTVEVDSLLCSHEKCYSCCLFFRFHSFRSINTPTHLCDPSFSPLPLLRSLNFCVLYSIFYYDYQVLAFRLCVGTLRGLSAASQLNRREQRTERNFFFFSAFYIDSFLLFLSLSLSLFFRVIPFPTNNNSSCRLGDIQKSDALPPSLSPLLNNLAIF